MFTCVLHRFTYSYGGGAILGFASYATCAHLWTLRENNTVRCSTEPTRNGTPQQTTADNHGSMSRSPPSKAVELSVNEEEASLRIAAACLSKQIIVETFKDQQVLNELIDLLLRAITRDEVKDAFKTFLKKQFDANENPHGTAEAVRTFLVDRIVNDPWVREQLIRLACDLGTEVYRNPQVWEETLAFLADTSWKGISSELFLQEVVNALKVSVLKWGGDAHTKSNASCVDANAKEK